MSHECKCNNQNPAEEPLVVTDIPRPVRHAAILGALESLPVGDTLLLQAPHMPSPLLAEAKDLDGEFSHEVVKDGPDEWLVRIRREA